MSDASQNPFSAEVVQAVADHMNRDHRDDSLLIVRALGRRPQATAATVTDVDGAAITFDAEVDGRHEVVRVPWSAPITERSRIRPEVVRMYNESCASLGLEPRTAEQR
jgi:Protein of unknown function (DUF2470)